MQCPPINPQKESYLNAVVGKHSPSLTPTETPTTQPKKLLPYTFPWTAPVDTKKQYLKQIDSYTSL